MSHFPTRRLAVCGTRVGGVRGGLASRGVAPTVLSGAALGHDRVRDGTGWGQHALGHGHPPPPQPAAGTRCCATTAGWAMRPHAPACAPTRPASPHHLTRPWTRPGRSCALGRAAAAGTRWLDLPLARAAPMPRHDTGMETDCGDPPSTIRTARLQSVARGPPAAYQPGHLPGVLPRKSGDARLGEGFPLRCFQRFARPHVATQRCRSRDNWHTSGASTPVLSY